MAKKRGRKMRARIHRPERPAANAGVPRPPDAWNARVELIRALSSLTDALVEMNAMAPPDGSPALQEMDSHSPGGLLASEPIMEALQLPRQLIGHVVDHLRGIVTLLGRPGIVVATYSLLRPAVESAALAHHLLEPSMTTQERVRRWGNVQLSSWYEQERIWNDHRDSPAWAVIQRQFTRAVDDAHAWGLSVQGKPTTADRRTPVPRYLDTPTPRTTALLTDLLHDGGLRAGGAYHRLLSAITHAQPHGLSTFTVTVDLSSGGPIPSVGKAFQESLSDVSGLIYPLLRGLGTLVARAAPFYGWETSIWQPSLTRCLVAFGPH